MEFRASPPPTVIKQHMSAIDFDGGQVFTWKEGTPTAKTGKSFQKEQMQQLFNAGVASPYIGQWNSITQQYEIEPEFEGLTNGEVIIMREVGKAAAGDGNAATRVLDRVLGKPKQAVESVSMRMSYTDFLNMMAQEDASEPEEPSKQIIDINPPKSIFDDPGEEDEDLLEGI